MSSFVERPSLLDAAVRQTARDIWLCFVEARPIVQGIFLLRFLVGAVVGVDGLPLGPNVVVAGVAWALTVWSVYLVNGVSDLSGDQRNGSSRPLASGALSRSTAIEWAWALSLAAGLIAMCVSIGFTLAVCLMLALGLAYSVGPLAAKRWAASALAVAAGGAFLTYIAGATASGAAVDTADISFAAVVSLWIAVTGHTKDFGDTEGDAATGRRTLPLVFGHDNARSIVAWGTITVAVVAMTVAISLPRLSLFTLFVPAAAFIAFLLFRLPAGHSPNAKRPYKAFMVAQYGVNLTALILLVAD